MNVAVVKVDGIISNEKKSQIRDDLLESLQKGILVVDDSYSIEVMDLPLEHELMLAFDKE